MKKIISILTSLLIITAFSSCIDSAAEKIVFQSQTHTIEIRQMKFIPASLNVKPGDKVVFINNDMVVHDITEASKAWSHRIEVSKSWTMVVKDNMSYYCSLHPVMKGVITIK